MSGVAVLELIDGESFLHSQNMEGLGMGLPSFFS